MNNSNKMLERINELLEDHQNERKNVDDNAEMRGIRDSIISKIKEPLSKIATDIKRDDTPVSSVVVGKLKNGNIIRIVVVGPKDKLEVVVNVFKGATLKTEFKEPIRNTENFSSLSLFKKIKSI